jgi:hypothetical protein
VDKKRLSGGENFSGSPRGRGTPKRMNSALYFVCAFRFNCTSCKQVSIEQLIAESHWLDPNNVVRSIMKNAFNCQHCLAPIADGADVYICVEPATDARLRAMGFSPERTN